jgi:hypothetical protein
MANPTAESANVKGSQLPAPLTLKPAAARSIPKPNFKAAAGIAKTAMKKQGDQR